MIDARRQAYLQAMEIPVWISREAAVSPSEETPHRGIRVGPGGGPVLLVCLAVDEPARRVAADIARCLRGEPVWAWPDADETNELPDVVREHMFTSLLILGQDLAERLLGSGIPETLGPARVLVAPSIDDMAARPSAKRELWRLIAANGLAGSPEAGADGT